MVGFIFFIDFYKIKAHTQLLFIVEYKLINSSKIESYIDCVSYIFIINLCLFNASIGICI
jgi:hypothetical protein